MRSGTSYFDRTVFKKTVLRFWPLWAAYLVVWLLALPLSGVMYLRLQGQNGGSYMENFAFSHVPGSVPGVLVLAAGFGAMCAMAAFSHLYNARSANFFGSLPVRREGLFLTHYLAGLSFTIVPNIIIALLTLLVELAGGVVSWQGLGFWLGVSCGECLLFYTMAVFCAMFTGHILALPAFYAVLNVLVYGVQVLIQTTMQAFYYGYNGRQMGWTGELVRWFTPALNLGNNVYSYYSYPAVRLGEPEPAQRVLETHGLWTVGIYAIAALVLAACAFLLYRARHMESAGDVVSVKVMRPVFKYGVAACVGPVFGYASSLFLGRGEATLMVSILVWGLIGYFAAQMLLDKSFRVFHKWKGATAVAGAFVLLFLVVGFDLTGYETRVPETAQVEGVYLSGLSADTLGDDGDYVYLNLGEDDHDQAVIELLTVLHRGAVEQRGRAPGGEGWISGYLDLTYTLKDGSTLSRRYDNLWLNAGEARQEGTASWAMEQLLEDREFYWQVYGFDSLEENLAKPDWRLSEVEYENYEYENYKYERADYVENPSRFYYGKDAQALLAAVKEDFFAGRIGVRTLTHDNTGPMYNHTLRFEAENSEGYLNHVRIQVQDSASSTLAVLERLEG